MCTSAHHKKVWCLPWVYKHCVCHVSVNVKCYLLGKRESANLHTTRSMINTDVVDPKGYYVPQKGPSPVKWLSSKCRKQVPSTETYKTITCIPFKPCPMLVRPMMWNAHILRAMLSHDMISRLTLQPTHLSSGYWELFPWEVSGWSPTLTTYINPVPTFRMCVLSVYLLVMVHWHTSNSTFTIYMSDYSTLNVIEAIALHSYRYVHNLLCQFCHIHNY
jgi:hypothetical protein